MLTRRRARILGLLANEGSSLSGTKRLCRMAVSATGLSGAGIMIISDGGPQGSLCTTGVASGVIEDLQYTLGEGPAIDSYREDRAVVEPNLATPEVLRWPMFSGPAVEAGARAVFGFPIRVGAVRFGALNLYRRDVGSLTADQHADSLVSAEIIAEAVLALQAAADEGELAEALTVDSDFRYVVHQASGMLSVQLGVSVEEASIRLRAYAFGIGTTLTEIATAVVEGRLRLSESNQPDGPS